MNGAGADEAAAGGAAGDEAAGGGADGAARRKALARLEEAVEERGLADPRPRYRRLLKRLAGEDRPAYRDAVRRFEEELVPAVAGGEADPAAAWTRYGLRVAGELVDGGAVAVDGSGRARAVEDPGRPPVGELLLWVPDDGGEPALVLSRPAELSDPQEATVELLT